MARPGSVGETGPGHSGTPALEALSGPLQGQVFELKDEEGAISLGREPDNAISIREIAVSRHHCQIERREDGRYVVRDLDSRNSTFVNGVPVKEKALEPADQIRVGSSVFLFRYPVDEETEDEATEGTGGKIRSSESLLNQRTVVLSRAEALYLRPADAGKLPANATTVRHLKVLLDFSNALNSVRGMEALQQRMLESLRDLAPAEKVVLLLGEDGRDEIRPVAAWSRRGDSSKDLELSSTVVNKVLEERVAVLANGIALGGQGEYDTVRSLVARSVRSVLAVPLEVFDKVLGVVYLETEQGEFDRELLELVTALGNIAALALQNGRYLEWLEGENQRLQEELHLEHNMVGESPAMQSVYQFISRVASTDSTALIWGESGTGKELVARAIHQNSPRKNKAFVAINCAAIAETLLESELFGHEKGAFTGAVGQKRGKLEAAEGGTVFLDEIGELAPLLQAKLLRVLQEREFERVGGTRPIPLNIRLIAATNRDLKEMSRTGGFRQDLYYRLNVVSVKMPPLRERRPDIAPLANFFAARYAERVKRHVIGLSPKAMACLMRYEWPGNVRELENAIERAVVLGNSEVILPEDLPESVLEQAGSGSSGGGEVKGITPLHDALLQAKREIILRAVEQVGGNWTEAARSLGVHPNHLFRLARTLELKPGKRSTSGKAL